MPISATRAITGSGRAKPAMTSSIEPQAAQRWQCSLSAARPTRHWVENARVLYMIIAIVSEPAFLIGPNTAAAHSASTSR